MLVVLSIEIKAEETAVKNIKSNTRELRKLTLQLLAERSQNKTSR